MFVLVETKNRSRAPYLEGSGHNGGEKGNVLIVSVLLSITIYFALRSETQGGVKVLKRKGIASDLARIRRVCVLLLQDLLQSCSRGGRRRVEDMCYERRRAEACVDESAHHTLVNTGGREIV